MKKEYGRFNSVCTCLMIADKADTIMTVACKMDVWVCVGVVENM